MRFKILQAVAVLAVFALMPATAAVLTAPGPPAAGRVAARVVVAPLRVMTLGDSITAGIGDPAGGGYRCTLGTYLAAQGLAIDFVGSLVSGPCADNEHEGHSGFTITQLTAIAADRVTTYRPDVVLVLAGTNDFKLGQTAGINDRLGVLIDTIQAAGPDALVIVSTIPAYPAADQAAWRAYRGDVPVVAQAHGASAAYGHNVRAAELVDGIHPKPCGYVKLAFYLDDAVTRVVPSPTGRSWSPVWPVGGCA